MSIISSSLYCYGQDEGSSSFQQSSTSWDEIKVMVFLSSSIQALVSRAAFPRHGSTCTEHIETVSHGNGNEPTSSLLSDQRLMAWKGNTSSGWQNNQNVECGYSQWKIKSAAFSHSPSLSSLTEPINSIIVQTKNQKISVWFKGTGQRSFSYAVPSVWNSFPCEVWSSHSHLLNHLWNLTSSSYPINSFCVCVLVKICFSCVLFFAL